MLPEDQPFVHEGLAGTLFRGRAARRTAVADAPALVAEIEGSAWITGEHTLILDDEDPFKDGR
jgi:proline racemase